VKIVVGNKLLADLSEVELEMFFEKYHRGANTSNTAGAGLGLWLVKNIVKQHDGSITLAKTGRRIEATIILPVIIDNQQD
jgi:K+-sensing histidine kinase KdpD